MALDLSLLSLSAGFVHPILGLDHLLAMVSVGVVSAIVGGRAIWTIPTIFVATMAAGGVVGLNGLVIIGTEFWISISLIALGLVVAANKMGSAKSTDFTVFLTMIFVSSFGLVHGNAHGLEVPQTSGPVGFTIGFLIGTTTLHIFGVGFGTLALRHSLLAQALRIAGLFTAALGVGLLTRHVI